MRKWFIPLAILIILFLLLAVHFVVYEGVLLVFGLNTGSERLLPLKIIFPLLGLSFVAASLLTAKWNTLFTRIFYRFSAAWLGFAVYFFLATVIFVLASYFGLAFQVELLLGRILFLIAALAGIYGLFHANNIKITAAEISLPHMPSAWKGRRIVFVSDLHLGQVHGARFAAKIASLILGLKADLVLIGGDLYDGVVCNEKEIIRPLEALTKTTAIPFGTYFITGNHEEFRGSSAYIDAVRSAGIRVLNNEKVDLEGIEIVGVDYETTQKEDNFKKVLAGLTIDPLKPNILIKHEPSHLDISAQAGIHLQFSGHTHQAQMFPFNVLTYWIYHGFDYGLHAYSEQPRHNSIAKMQVFTSSGVGTWGPPFRVGTRSEIVLVTFR